MGKKRPQKRSKAGVRQAPDAKQAKRTNGLLASALARNNDSRRMTF
jgi:hypothetical protein